MNNADMPAMPQSGTEGVSGDINSSEDWGGKGPTKLEHFAGLAMQGILSGIPVNEVMPSTELAAMHAVDYAKALLQQLEGGEDE